MKDFLLFANAVADPTRLRIIALAMEHKLTSTEIANVLKLTPDIIAQQLQELTHVGILKAVKKSPPGKVAKPNPGAIVAIRRRHADMLDDLFEHFELEPKKDAMMRHDAKVAQRLREEAKANVKPKSKVKPKTKAKAEQPTKKTKA